MPEPIEITNSTGRVVLWIDHDGSLWSERGRVVGNPPNILGLRKSGTAKALDGSVVTDFGTPAGLVLQRFTPADAPEWWSVKGNLCSPKDIDQVRRELRQGKCHA